MYIIGRVRDWIDKCLHKNEDIQTLKTDADNFSNDPYAVTLGVTIDDNKIGASGEDYFASLFTWCGCYVEFLGDKAPDVDFLVTFRDKDGVFEFLVQVKATGTLRSCSKTVKSGITSDEYNRLRIYHLPTYLARVDMPNQIVYMKPAYKTVKKAKYSMVSKKWALSLNALPSSRNIVNRIATDVKRYWQEGLDVNYKANFKSYIDDDK